MKRIITMIIALACAFALTQCNHEMSHEEQIAYDFLSGLGTLPKEGLKIESVELTFTETLRSEVEERVAYLNSLGKLDKIHGQLLEYLTIFPKAYPDHLDDVTFREYKVRYSYMDDDKKREDITTKIRVNASSDKVVAASILFTNGPEGKWSKWVTLGDFFSIPKYYIFVERDIEKEGDLSASLSR